VHSYDTAIFVSQRGDTDLLIRFIDDSGEVTDKVTLSDFCENNVTRKSPHQIAGVPSVRRQ
jgi:hypothetical protein